MKSTLSLIKKCFHEIAIMPACIESNACMHRHEMILEKCASNFVLRDYK